MIEVSNLEKIFKTQKTNKSKNNQLDDINDVRQQGGAFHAVRDVSFSCATGEVLGLLGPNGAGKTTTLRMLSTALTPSSGSIHISGTDVIKNPLEARKLIGFLSGTTGLYRRLSVKENVQFFGRLHNLSEEVLESRMDELFSLLDMHSFTNKKADDLSTGMKQKTSIVRAVIHQPEIIVFDEPTTGLDVMAAQTVLDFISSYKERKIPVIFSTHHLHEIESLCDNICVINQGISSYFGTPTQLMNETSSDSLYDSFLSLVKVA